MHEQQHGTSRKTGPALRLPGVAKPVESLAEFERLLKPRTTVPTQRYARFLRLGDEGLAAGAVTTRSAANHLQRVLSDLRGRSSRVDVVLGGIALTFFSEDHGWRSIFQMLIGAPGQYTEHKLIAVAGYRRYLLNCLDSLNQVSTDRLQSALCVEAHAEEEEQTSLGNVTSLGYDSRRERAETLVRDLMRLPQGSTLSLRDGRDGPFELWLGKHRFRVETWAGAALVDEKGQSTPLRDGRNVIGRGLYNDVIVDAEFADVSRRHLILDLQEGVPVAVTDLSSGGTWVPRTLVRVAAA
jgi:hypothetical protein